MFQKFLNTENASITLFVLLAILFFMIVIFSLFVSSSNKEQSQISEIDKIKQEYEQSIDNIDQIYQNTLNENSTNPLDSIQIGDYVNYDPTNGGEITTTYTSPQGTYHANSTTSDTSENMIEGNGYANQTFSVSANTNGWRVLDIDKDTNQILLISADIIKTTENKYFF